MTKIKLFSYICAIFLFFLSLALLSNPALASTANDIFGTTSPIRKLVAFMTGPFAFLVVIVGIVIMGSMLIFGNDLSGFGRRVLLLVLGGGLVLGSIQVVSKLFSAGRQAGALYAPGDIPPMDWPLLRPGNPVSQPPEAALSAGLECITFYRIHSIKREAQLHMLVGAARSICSETDQTQHALDAGDVTEQAKPAQVLDHGAKP